MPFASERFRAACAVSLLTASTLACGGGPTEPLPLVGESEHFVFLTSTAFATEAEVQEGLDRSEELFAKIAMVVGADLVPSGKITVNLDGPIKGRGPYVDGAGIHLFRYSASEGGYWTLLAHEMVHGFRVDWFFGHEAANWPTFKFYDEAFAEFVAQLVDEDKQGFPFFGFPEDIVAGHWAVNGPFLPLSVLRARHDELNQPCEFQSYPERASWLRYIDEYFGRHILMKIVYPAMNPTDAFIRDLTGMSLAEIDEAWVVRITARFHAHPGAAQLATAYMDRIGQAYVCEAGVDF